MSVDPLKSHHPSQADAARLAASSSARRSEPAAEESSAERPATGGDSIELSAASRLLVGQSDEAGRVPEGTLSPERMREVLRRLESGFYQRDDVRDAVARGVRRDLGPSPTE
jgi:hypothetical protein